ncbi:11066_t:CDS:2 [Cetraspora pellucida]|uniref:11066_t:CDS:1 n=1 Tax=Cetraspora pellucida TaxID=1433469 RepID=A0ACA9ME86_9GLOM|nr:11066_t:CDS:2 [Cetraspora pellucida]
MEQSAAASQKTMTKFMLFLIIFLLEYIVYKRNGLPGLIVLNVLLAIAYYYRDTLKEYYPAKIKFPLFATRLNYYSSQPSGLGGYVDEYSIFANDGELRMEQLDNLKTVIQIKEEAEKKELELQKQAETLQKAAELQEQLKEKLSQAEEKLMSPEKILKIAGTVILKEIEDRLYPQSQETETAKSLTERLAKMPTPAEEEQQLLSQLYLTLEQFIAISCQAVYRPEEKDWIIDNYSALTKDQKLKLLSAGLNNLGIDTYVKKQKFVQINHTLHQEKANFGLSVKEKESILRLLITTLDLTNEQRENLENMGVSFFDASNWNISEEQKQHLLDFGLNKLKLASPQKEELTIIHPDQFKTFSLTGPQKNILNSLSPLIKEDKYSENSLQLFRSLNLKSHHQTFFVREEIIPDPNTAFGVAKSSYLSLKIKSLMSFAKKTIEEGEYYLKDFNFSLADWVKAEPPTDEEIFYESRELPETKESKEPQEPKPASSTSRYDNLSANLNKKDAERQQKKLERQEAQRKFEESERQRREEKLAEKDQKLKEDEERRQKERELAEQEEQKRREAEAARAESLQKEQKALFEKKTANIEAAKKRAEENLANQIKQNELEEKKKRDEIEKMEKENEAEQERLKKQAELIEEEKQKKLAQIALEDEEERQRIEKRANEEKARIIEEMNEKRRRDAAELKKKENALLKEKETRQAEVERLEKEVKLQETLGKELEQAGARREAILKGQKNQQQALRELREQMYNACLGFYLNSDEIKKGTRYNGSPVPRSGCHYLRDLVRDFPDGWGMAMKTFYKAVGSQFVTTDELRRIIEREVHTLTYLDSR